MSQPSSEDPTGRGRRSRPSDRRPARAVFLAQRAVGALFILLIVLLIAAEVFLRTAFSVTLGLAHEVSGYLLVGVAFIGFAIALADEKLFRIELLYASFRPRVRQIVQLVFDLVSLVFSLVLLRYLVAFVVSSYNGGYSSSTSLAAPLFVPQLAMPLGIALVSLSLLVRIADGVWQLRHPLERESGR